MQINGQTSRVSKGCRALVCLFDGSLDNPGRPPQLLTVAHPKTTKHLFAELCPDRLVLLFQPVDLVAKGHYPAELSVKRVSAPSQLSMDGRGLTIPCVIIRRRSG